MPLTAKYPAVIEKYLNERRERHMVVREKIYQFFYKELTTHFPSITEEKTINQSKKLTARFVMMLKKIKMVSFPKPKYDYDKDVNDIEISVNFMQKHASWIFPSSVMTSFSRQLEFLRRKSLVFTDIVRVWFKLDNLSDEALKAYFMETDFNKKYTIAAQASNDYKSHQKVVTNFFSKNADTVRYGLFYHEMGSGKTCTATSVIEAISHLDRITDVIVLVPNEFLVNQFVNDFKFICSFIKRAELPYVDSMMTSTKMPIYYEKKSYYIFTYNQYLGSNLKTIINPETTAMFVDEAHNFRSTTAVAGVKTRDNRNIEQSVKDMDEETIVYGEGLFMDILHQIQGFRYVFFMTGTPTLNSISDSITLINDMMLLSGSDRRINDKTCGDIKFVVDGNNRIVVEEESVEKLKSCVKTFLEQTGGFISRVRVSDMEDLLIPDVDFTHHYYDYSDDFDTKGIGKSNESNTEIIKKKYDVAGKAHPIPVQLTQEEYVMMPTPSKGVIPLAGNNLKQAERVANSPMKLNTLLNELESYYKTTPSPALIHTRHIKTVEDLVKMLKDRGYRQWKMPSQNSVNIPRRTVTTRTTQPQTVPHPTNNSKNSYKQPVFAVIHGGVRKKEVQSIVQEYNDESNENGENIRVCIITMAAGTGFTFRNTRQLHIVEPYWNFSYLQQVTGRAVRHNVFDKEPKHVKIFAYISVPPNHGSATRFKTIEQHTYDLMIKKMFFVEIFSKILHTLSIENNPSLVVPPTNLSFHRLRLEQLEKHRERVKKEIEKRPMLEQQQQKETATKNQQSVLRLQGTKRYTQGNPKTDKKAAPILSVKSLLVPTALAQKIPIHEKTHVLTRTMAASTKRQRASPTTLSPSKKKSTLEKPLTKKSKVPSTKIMTRSMMRSVKTRPNAMNVE